MDRDDSLRYRWARWYLDNYEKPWFKDTFATIYVGTVVLLCLAVNALVTWAGSEWGFLILIVWTTVVIRFCHSVYNQKEN